MSGHAALAVDWALKYNEVHKLTELKAAQEIIAEGKQRAEQLKNGQHPWTTQKGLVVRGYRSKIDGSVQPYGMVIPESYSGAPSRLDAWCHGRGETLSELGFIDQRRKQVGNVAPANTLVLHPYGRYCCANKFAGEVDLLEALDHAKKFYAIDEDHTIVRGFSMGGAAAWQFAVNYAEKWCAANPGAGFAETPEFLNVFQSEDVSKIPAYEKTRDRTPQLPRVKHKGRRGNCQTGDGMRLFAQRGRMSAASGGLKGSFKSELKLAGFSSDLLLLLTLLLVLST